MAQDLNQVMLEGHLGRDAESNGQSIFFTLASNRSYKDKNGDWQDQTTWAAITYYRSTSDKLTAALSKGTRVRVVGELNTYTKEGEKITRFNIRASDITFLPALKGRGADEPSNETPSARSQPTRAAAPTRGGTDRGQRGALTQQVQQRGRRPSAADEFSFDDDDGVFDQ